MDDPAAFFSSSAASQDPIALYHNSLSDDYQDFRYPPGLAPLLPLPEDGNLTYNYGNRPASMAASFVIPDSTIQPQPPFHPPSYNYATQSGTMVQSSAMPDSTTEQQPFFPSYPFVPDRPTIQNEYLSRHIAPATSGAQDQAFQGMSNMTVEQRPLLLPGQTFIPINSPFQREYTSSEIREGSMPLCPGETCRGAEVDVIDQVPSRRIRTVPSTQRPVRKPKRGRLRPTERPPPKQAPPPEQALPPEPAPPSTAVQSKFIPKSTTDSLNEEAKNSLRTYFLMTKPIQSKDDNAHIDNLAIDLTTTYFHESFSKFPPYWNILQLIAYAEGDWLNENAGEFRKMGLCTLHETVDSFKKVAHVSIKDSYEMRLSVHEHGSPSHWICKVDELLVGWTFTDAPMLVSNQYSTLQTAFEILNRSKANSCSAYSTIPCSRLLCAKSYGHPQANLLARSCPELKILIHSLHTPLQSHAGRSTASRDDVSPILWRTSMVDIMKMR